MTLDPTRWIGLKLTARQIEGIVDKGQLADVLTAAGLSTKRRFTLLEVHDRQRWLGTLVAQRQPQ